MFSSQQSLPLATPILSRINALFAYAPTHIRYTSSFPCGSNISYGLPILNRTRTQAIKTNTRTSSCPHIFYRSPPTFCHCVFVATYYSYASPRFRRPHGLDGHRDFPSREPFLPMKSFHVSTAKYIAIPLGCTCSHVRSFTRNNMPCLVYTSQPCQSCRKGSRLCPRPLHQRYKRRNGRLQRQLKPKLKPEPYV